MSSSACPFTSNTARVELEAVRQALAKADTRDRAEILETVIRQWHRFSLPEQRSSLAVLREELPGVLPLGAQFRLALALVRHRCDLDISLHADALALSASLDAGSPQYRYSISGLV